MPKLTQCNGFSFREHATILHTSQLCPLCEALAEISLLTREVDSTREEFAFKEAVSKPNLPYRNRGRMIP